MGLRSENLNNFLCWGIGSLLDYVHYFRKNVDNKDKTLNDQFRMSSKGESGTDLSPPPHPLFTINKHTV